MDVNLKGIALDRNGSIRDNKANGDVEMFFHCETQLDGRASLALSIDDKDQESSWKGFEDVFNTTVMEVRSAIKAKAVVCRKLLTKLRTVYLETL